MRCKLINLGNNATAIMCGGKPDHECDEKASVLLLADGDRIEDTPENQAKYMEQIRGGSVACSICGRAAIDDAVWL